MKNHLFCFGLGYVAQHLINSLEKDLDWKISGTKRVESSSTSDRVEAFRFDDLSILPRDITHILVSIPPKDDGDLVVQQFGKQILKLPNLQWVGYLSATGVYGDTKGEWVDENSPLNPSNSFSKKRLMAEQQWQSLGIPLNIFRLSAIYGPERNAIEQVKAGHAKIIDLENQVFSRIHIDDIVQVLRKTMTKNIIGEVYNVTDDKPTSSNEVIEFACQLLQVPPPKPVKLEDAELSEMGKVFYSENRRIRNDKIKSRLGVTLKYPSYKEGLKATLNE